MLDACNLLRVAGEVSGYVVDVVAAVLDPKIGPVVGGPAGVMFAAVVGPKLKTSGNTKKA